MVVNDPVFETNAPKEEKNTVAEVKPTEKVVFNLEEVEEKEVQFEIQNVTPAMDLIPTTELIKNLDVTFEVIAPKETMVTPVFEIITPQIKNIEVVDPEFVVKEDKFSFSLDLFANETIEESKKTFELTEETKQIEVKEHINLVPVTEVNKNGVIKYSLEDYLQKEDELLSSKPVEEVNEPVDEELNFAVKKTEQPSLESAANLDNESPFEMTIEETLKARSDERKRKMKEFNYKFNNNTTYIDEIEKEPAYKRMGIDVTSAPSETNSKSRMTLGTDSNDDLQLRSNNSFLHDNVD